MSIKVKPDDLSKEILKQMEIYTEEVERKVAEAVIKVGDQTAKDLRTVNQVAGSNVWKNYPRGWSNQKKKTRGKQISEVHNRTEYRLTHLLEHGHVIKNGTGRTYGRTRSFEHIGPVNEEAQKRLEEAIMEAIEKG